MKLKLKALAAAFALVAASSANAAISPTNGPSGGSLLFEAWDATQAFIMDLGQTFDSTYGSAAAVTAQPGGDTVYNLGTAFTTPFSGNPNVQWHVISGKSVLTAAGNNGMLSTASTTAFTAYNNNAINSMTSGAQTQVGNIATALGAASSGTVTNTSPAYTPNNWGANGQYGPLNTALGNTGNAITGFFTGAINAATSYAAGTGVAYFASVINTNNGAGNLAQTARTAFAGSLGNADWILQSNGTLTYHVAAPAAVPLPAAFWLFGSGLLGLVGIGRRKKNA